LLVDSAYIALAWSQGEVKQFDAGIWTLFATGTLATRVGIEPVLRLYQRYSPTLLFVTLGLTALIPLLLGRETFTYYYARRQFPRWQLKVPEFQDVSRVMTAYWTLLFFTAASLAAFAPTDWHFTFLYPNLMIFGVGMTATVWLPPLYFRFFPPALPRAVEPLIMGMPLVFDRKAARDTRASIQFRVSGSEPGDYYLAIARGRCRSFEGGAPPAPPPGRRRGKGARPPGALGALEGRGGGAPADATPPTLNWAAAPPRLRRCSRDPVTSGGGRRRGG